MGSQGTPDDPNGYKKGKTIKKRAWKNLLILQFYVMREAFMRLHVIRKCGVDRPPITCNVENDEKQKQREEQPGRDLLSYRSKIV